MIPLEALLLSICLKGSQAACQGAASAYYMQTLKAYEEPLRKRYPALERYGAVAAGLAKQTVVVPLNETVNLSLTIYPSKANLSLTWRF